MGPPYVLGDGIILLLVEDDTFSTCWTHLMSYQLYFEPKLSKSLNPSTTVVPHCKVAISISIFDLGNKLKYFKSTYC